MLFLVMSKILQTRHNVKIAILTIKLIQILFSFTRNMFGKGNLPQKTAVAINLVLDVREKKLPTKDVIGYESSFEFYF